MKAIVANVMRKMIALDCSVDEGISSQLCFQETADAPLMLIAVSPFLNIGSDKDLQQSDHTGGKLINSKTWR